MSVHLAVIIVTFLQSAPIPLEATHVVAETDIWEMDSLARVNTFPAIFLFSEFLPQFINEQPKAVLPIGLTSVNYFCKEDIFLDSKLYVKV